MRFPFLVTAVPLCPVAGTGIVPAGERSCSPSSNPVPLYCIGRAPGLVLTQEPFGQKVLVDGRFTKCSSGVFTGCILLPLPLFGRVYSQPAKPTINLLYTVAWKNVSSFGFWIIVVWRGSLKTVAIGPVCPHCKDKQELLE